jgi:hypothetical protein
VLLLTPLAVGCFEFRQVPVAAAPIGQDVRVRVTDAGYDRLAATIGEQVPRLRRILDGPLISVDDRSLLMGLATWHGRPGSRESLYQRVSVPLSDVISVERKVLDRRKTTLVAVGAGAVLIAFIARYVSGEFGGTTSPFPEPGPGESIQVPFKPF